MGTWVRPWYGFTKFTRWLIIEEFILNKYGHIRSYPLLTYSTSYTPSTLVVLLGLYTVFWVGDCGLSPSRRCPTCGVVLFIRTTIDDLAVKS